MNNSLRNIDALTAVWNTVCHFFTRRVFLLCFIFLLVFSFNSTLNAQITSTGAGGAWNNPATWNPNVVPSATDNVIIANGTTVTIDVGTATCLSMTINTGGTLISNAGINLDINGSWTNDGTFNAGTGTITFKGATNNTISGSSPTAFNNIIINKGADVNSVLEATGSGAISNTGTLTITNGLLKMTTGTFQFGGSSQVTIPASGGIWVNGGNFSSGFYKIVNNGLIKISSGTANFGTGSGNEVHNQSNGAFQVSGGNVIISGRLENTASGTLSAGISSGVTISGGLITLATQGNGASNTGSFDMSTSSSLNMSGGTVIFQNPSTAAIPIDLNIISGGTKSISGGTFQFGNASSPANSTFLVSSGTPLYNLSVFSNSVKVSLATNNLTVNNLLTLNGQLQLNNQNLIIGATAPAIAGTLGAGNGMIITNSSGEVRKNLTFSFAYFFPIGSSSTEYSPVDVNFTAGTYSSAYVGVRVVNTKHPSNTNTNNYLNRYWLINTSGITGPLYNVTATYLATDVVGNDANIASGEYKTLPWLKHGAANTGARTISSTGVANTGSTGFTGISLANPIVTITGNVPFCIGSSIVLNTTVTGDPTITYSWSPNNETTSSITVSSAGTYTVTITDGNGLTATDNVTVTVNPLPTIFNTTGGGGYCAGGSGVTVGLSNSQSGINYQLQIGGVNKGSPVAGSGAAISFGPQTAAGNYTVVATNASTGCTVAMNGSVTVTINPLPSVTVNSPIICSSAGSATMTATPTGGTAPYSYSWTVPGGANPGNTASFSATIAGSYSVIVTDFNNCSSVAGSGTLTIVAAPTANAGGNQSTCSNSGAVSITSATATNNSGVSWGTSGTGTFTNGTTLTPTYTPSAADITAGSVTLTLTATGNAPCGNATSNKTLTIVAAPTANAGSDQITCSNIGAVSITGASATNNAGVNWSTSGTGTFTNGNTLTPSYTPSAADITAGSVILTLTATGNAPCSNAISTKTLTIVAAPTANAGSNQSTCSNSGVVSITGASATNNAGVNWSTTGTGSFTNGNTLTPSYTPSAADITAGSVTLTLTAAGNAPCSDAISTKTLTIVAAPTANAGSNQSTCSNSGTVSITGASATNISGVSWSTSGTGTFFNGNTLTPTYTPSATDISTGSVTLTLTAIGNAPCANVTSTKTLTINPAPVPTISGPNSVCAGSTGNIYSTEASMTGYTWSVSSGGTITSGTGTNSITVTWNSGGAQIVTVNYTNANNCTASAATIYNVTVNAIPNLVINNPSAVCTPATVDLTAAAIIGAGTTAGLTYTYFTDAAGTISLSSPSAVAVSGTYYIKGTSAAGCSIIKPVTVTINASPTLVITNPAAVCSPLTVDLSLAAVTAGSTGGLTLTYWTNAGATISLSNYTTAGAGTYYIKGTTTDGCYDIKPVIVTVNTTPTVTTTNTASICSGANTNIALTASVASTFTWTIGTITGTVSGASAGSGSTISQVLTSSGNGGTVVYNVTPVSTVGNCTGAIYAITVTVNTAPVVTTQPEVINEVCAGTTANAVFTAAASGLPTPNIQWQVSTNGGTTWTNLTNGGNVSGATSNQLSLTGVTTANDGYKYRAIFTNSCSPSATSNVSTLSISGTIKIKTPLNSSGCITAGGYYTFSIELQGDQVASGQLQYSLDNGITWLVVPGSVQTLGNGTPTYSYAVLYNAYPAGTKFRVNLTSNKCSISFDSPDVIINSTITVNTTNTCVGGPNLTFTKTGDNTAGSWSVTGGGTINSSTGLFTPNNNPGCWVAKYVSTNGCEGYASFVVFPASPTLTTLSNTCNTVLASITAVTTISGFTAEYAVQAPGGSLSSYGTLAAANALLTNTSGCWTIKARYKLTASCGSNAANIVSTTCTEATVTAVVFPAAPVLSVPGNTCASAFTIPSVPAISGFTTEYSIDGGAFTSSPSSSTTPGCHTIKARYTLTSACGSTTAGTSGGSSCESNTVSVVVFPAAPSAPVVSAGCGLFTVTAPPTISGFNIEYSFDDGATWTNPLPTAENCAGYLIRTRYVLSAACGTTLAGSASSSASCKESSATLRIVDLSNPVITCNVSSNPSVCVNSGNTHIHSGTSWDVSASDNCSLSSVSAMLTGATNAGPFSTLNAVVFNAGNTTVTWTATDACGRTATCSFTVTVYSLPTISTSATATSVCFSTSAQTSLLTYSGTTNSPITYSIIWNAAALTAGFVNLADAALPASPISIAVPANAPVGTYTGTITVKNANGCVSTSSVFTITINPKPAPIISHN